MHKFNICVTIIVLLSVLFSCGQDQTTITYETPEELRLPSYENLMPLPSTVDVKDGKLYLNDEFMIKAEGAESSRLARGIGRAVHRLAGRTGLFLPQVFFEPGTPVVSANMIISVEEAVEVSFGMDETYVLEISPDGILLSSQTDVGALRGLETFLQLLDADEKGYYLPAVHIVDEPRFPWRGLLIDACRHFMPVEVIKRNLDGMAAVKMNVLHWHLTEDQGFRVESKVYPKLHELGSDGFYYTHEQIREVIHYAADRGIRVIPEFDLPGHATSWLVAYPELASAPGPYKIERRWGIMDPTIDPSREESYVFLERFLDEMSTLFTDDYVHIGGDENNGHHWDANPGIQQFKKKMGFADNADLQNYFNQRLLKILQARGKKMIGWDEILHPDMPKDIVLQSWRGHEAMIKAAQRGYRSLLSNGYYIDLHQPTDFHYLNDPLSPDSPLKGKEQELILGGEATMWAEFVSPEIVDSRIWPRTAAIAERLWSPGTVKDVADMYRRLKITSFRLEELGLTHERNYGMMLRRLTGNQDVSALKTLIDVVESVKIYNRNRQRTHYSYSPLTRVVDAARPDAEMARNFRQDVHTLLEGGAKDLDLVASITLRLQLWSRNHTDLDPIISNSPILEEIRPMSKNLTATAQLGLEAMHMISTGKSPNSEWVTRGNAVLEEASKPVAQTELMIVPAIQDLVTFFQ